MKSSLILVSLVFFLRTGSAQSWIQTSAPTNMGDSTFIASSADGRRLIAAGSNPSYFPPVAGPVYTSDDWGNSWTSNHIPPAVWSSAVSSADGGRMMLGTSGGYVFSTTNYGDTWSSNQLQATGQSVNLAL
ncbi:MAG TPA: hypothetical protein VFV81_09505, partial [Verrucomicrobiae bacterium]|nr:hypothetical protein [Verrucomicrobiae bacterium]